MKTLSVICIASALLFCACGGKSTAASASADPKATKADSVTACIFDADSAYSFIEKQLAFGPRIPGTAGHKACQQWIFSSLKQFGADTVIVQTAPIIDTHGRRLTISNILARFNGKASATDRILLAAHYDTRSHATSETDPERAAQPVPGANDGGSGVAVMLELARQMGLSRPERAVDLLFVDAEDDGDDSDPRSWCLGSQHWSQNMPYTSTAADPRPRFGIVLDMVGGTGAQFHREYYSDAQAPEIVDLVWRAARVAGHGSRFIDKVGGGIIDDHLFINEGGIPCIDIIENNNPATEGFPPGWHTLDDNMSGIDRATLRAVGETISTVIRQK